jgi:GT2 family glycosyltransferase
MDLSIIILNYQTKNLVKYCIKGIKSLNLNLDYEIIVVDNASYDRTFEMIREEFSGVKFIQAKENRGYAAGNNLGIKQARGKYILLLNPDIVILENAIEKMYQFMENHSEAGLIGPKLNSPDGTLQETCYRFPKFIIPLYRRTFLGKLPFIKKHLDHFLMKDYDHQIARQVDWLQGSCLMARVKAVQEVGLLDERFFTYVEDTDWSRRFWQKGWQVWYLPEAKMIHYHEQASAGGLLNIFKKSARIHIASWLKYFWKYRNQLTDNN